MNFFLAIYLIHLIIYADLQMEIIFKSHDNLYEAIMH